MRCTIQPYYSEIRITTVISAAVYSMVHLQSYTSMVHLHLHYIQLQYSNTNAHYIVHLRSINSLTIQLQYHQLQCTAALYNCSSTNSHGHYTVHLQFSNSLTIQLQSVLYEYSIFTSYPIITGHPACGRVVSVLCRHSARVRRVAGWLACSADTQPGCGVWPGG